MRLSSVEALGEMVGLVTRSQLKSALPRIIPTMLDLYGFYSHIFTKDVCQILPDIYLFAHVDVGRIKKLLLLRLTVFITFLMRHYCQKVVLLYLILR